MNIKHIIVQAGGRGSRMESLTRNKPKALVPVENLPMLFHLFKKFPEAHFIVIGDYKYDVLKRYLEAFADVNYDLVCATGKKGTIAGLDEALGRVGEDDPFLLIWSDLVLPEDYHFPQNTDVNYIGIAKDFSCRWSFRDGKLSEWKSADQGVAGFFIFKNREVLKDIPAEGELVRWLRDQEIPFVEEPLYHTHEYGLKSEYDKLGAVKCRPFNAIEIENDRLIKRPLDDMGRNLAEKEAAWYRKVAKDARSMDEIHIPEIYDYEPLSMELIDGKNIYEYDDIPYDEKKRILEDIIRTLKGLHKIGSVPGDRDSFYEAYIGKTAKRLEKVRDLVPFANDETIVINGRKCRNVFYHWEELEKEVMRFMPKEFVFLHGDCTFSNMMLKNDETPVLIDPRGYFGNTQFYGDGAYDWVKLYYSLVSDYDQFNLKRFSLDIGKEGVELQVKSNYWAKLEDDFFALVDLRSIENR